MEALKTIAKGAGIVFIGILFSKILTYIYRVIVARIGAAEYGILSLALAIFGVLTVFAVLGLNVGVVRYFAYYRAKHQERKVKGVITSSLKITGLLGVVFGVLLFVFADRIALFFFREPQLGLILKIFAIGLPFYALKEVALAAITAAKQMFHNIFVRNIFEGALKVLLTAVFVIFGLGLIGASWAHVIALIVATFLGFYLLERKTFQVFTGKIIADTRTKELLGYSIPIMFTALLAQIVSWIDVLMIGHFKTVIDVGISRGEDGKIHGDVDFENVKQKAAFITPMPGGTGPMTRACLLENVLKAAVN